MHERIWPWQGTSCNFPFFGLIVASLHSLSKYLFKSQGRKGCRKIDKEKKNREKKNKTERFAWSAVQYVHSNWSGQQDSLRIFLLFIHNYIYVWLWFFATVTFLIVLAVKTVFSSFFSLIKILKVLLLNIGGTSL